jgi:hypothetical protein
MDQTRGHDYDSFVVRLWRDANTRALLRAEVEHVQSGSVGVSLDATWDWLGERLQAAEGRRRVVDQPSPAGTPPTAADRRRPVL